MTLEELLEYTASEYLDDRSDMLSGDPDSLWSDTTITRHLNKAQQILCRRSWVLVDVGNATVGVITLVDGQALYPVHASVLHVYHAAMEDTGILLGRATDRHLLTSLPWDTEYFNTESVFAEVSGRPRALATDAGTRTIRVYPTPDADSDGLNLILKVAHMPITLLSTGSPNGVPEVPEEWHMSLAAYAAGKCLTYPTVDSDQKAEGRALLAEFNNEVREARQERQRFEQGGRMFEHNTMTAHL